MAITQREQVILQMDTDATRKYPFSRTTLDQIQDIRYQKEKDLNELNPGKEYLVPAPIVIAEAIADLHEKMFP